MRMNREDARTPRTPKSYQFEDLPKDSMEGEAVPTE